MRLPLSPPSRAFAPPVNVHRVNGYNETGIPFVAYPLVQRLYFNSAIGFGDPAVAGGDLRLAKCLAMVRC